MGKSESSAKVRPLIVFRVGYMDSYDGPDAIKFGGAYIRKKGEGGEMWNFAPSQGKCFGYVMTRHFSGIDVRRVARSAGRTASSSVLEGVDIAFVARRQGRGQVVVGAYVDATLHQVEANRYPQRRNPSSDPRHRKLDYLCETASSNAFLVPPSQRKFPVPFAPKDGKGYPGHSNVWYGDSPRRGVRTFVEKLRGYLHREVCKFPSMAATTVVAEIVKDDQEMRELERIVEDREIDQTTRWQLVRARVGQGEFRKRLERIETACRVTGIDQRDMLRASHIKPWCRSKDAEKLDGENGFLLTPHMDHLFDKGFMTFATNRALVVSNRLPKSIVKDWNLRGVCRGRPFTDKQEKYLRYHRRYIFK